MIAPNKRPEVIPSSCGRCSHFKRTGIVEGRCRSYNVVRYASSPCLAQAECGAGATATDDKTEPAAAHRPVSLEQMAERRDVAGLVQASKDAEPSVRRGALAFLAIQRDQRAFRALFEAAADTDPETKEVAKRTFWQYHNRVYADNFVRILQIVSAQSQAMKFPLLHAYLEKVISVEALQRDVKPAESEMISALLIYYVEKKGNIQGT